ncbi:MAG: 3-hydroxyacyl-CoA dehydrogenase NAD-binding domain-containing protein [Opitutaceae bacterium]|nr:3-hydroxyacyl-CoA dehydrogenase NAD-binding domain-containing protein [Opitutaceae bacterium]
MSPPLTHTVDDDGLGWIVFNDPGSRASALDPSMPAALHDALDGLAAARVKAVVILSAEERVFISGADLKMISSLPDAAAATAFSREGQQLFERLAGFKTPVVCAIHGVCAIGGCELALACHWRLASDAPATRIGLPQIGLGTIPGWGGCARLPRLIGAQAAVEHMLAAVLVPAEKALAVGIVDEVVPAATLKERARAIALKFAAEGIPSRPPPPPPPVSFYADQRLGVLASTGGRLPAPLALLEAVEKGGGRSLDEALGIEAELYGSLAAGEVCKNLIHILLLKDGNGKQTLDAWFPPAAGGPAPAPFRIIGIVGAGDMGSGITQWLAARGFGVILVDTQPDILKRSMEAVRKLFHESIARGETTHEAAHKALGGIAITTDVADLVDCDLVIEAIVEDVAAKRALLAEVAKVLPPESVLATSTSALPIEEISAQAAVPGRILGLHFFNPVNRMALVELVLGRQTTRATAERALAFSREIGKTPVVCKSAPGFLVTRVLFFCLNEACRLWEQGVPTDVIDRALCDWGWAMGPMRLIDEVGIDDTDCILGEMERYFPGRFQASTICRRMLAAGLKGRKQGASSGFYVYADGREAINPAMAPLAPAVPSAPPDVATLADLLLQVMIDETKRSLAEGVVRTPDEADLALLLGAGFPAFRGGLMRYARKTGLFAG